MSSSAFVFVLLLVGYASVNAFSLEERSIEIDDSGIDHELMMKFVKNFMAQQVGKDNCAAEKEERKDCECDMTSCACCKEESMFFGKNHKVCVDLVYLADTDKYEVVVDSDGENAFRGKIAKKGEADVGKVIKIDKADVTLTFECQKEENAHETGCLRITGEFKGKKVDIDLGCFKLKTK